MPRLTPPALYFLTHPPKSSILMMGILNSIRETAPERDQISIAGPEGMQPLITKRVMKGAHGYSAPGWPSKKTEATVPPSTRRNS